MLTAWDWSKGHIHVRPEQSPSGSNISPEKVFYRRPGEGVDAEPMPAPAGPPTLAEGGTPLAAEFAGDPGAEELSGAIDQLSDDEVIDLIGLTWVGRGDFDRAELGRGARARGRRHRRRWSRYPHGRAAVR